MEGFKALKGMNGPQRFNIHRCGDSRRLPSSHTCFNQLDLPEYSSEQQLHKSLLAAIREGFEGFGKSYVLQKTPFCCQNATKHFQCVLFSFQVCTVLLIAWPS
jgi:hypothetical protein